MQISPATYTYESCPRRSQQRRRVLMEWEISLLFTQTNELCHTCHWVMSHIPMSHITRGLRNLTAIHTNEWVMSHMSLSHVTHTNESYHTWLEKSHCYSPKQMSPVTHDNESCHTHINESCHTYQYVMSHSSYGVATISRLLQMIGLVCRISSLL